MEKTSPSGISPNVGSGKEHRATRRRRRGADDAPGRFFLPKQGSSLRTPELGQEMNNEGDALIQALKSDQPFYVLTIWKAVAQQNGGDPVIVKQAITDAKTE